MPRFLDGVTQLPVVHLDRWQAPAGSVVRTTAPRSLWCFRLLHLALDCPFPVLQADPLPLEPPDQDGVGAFVPCVENSRSLQDSLLKRSLWITLNPLTQLLYYFACFLYLVWPPQLDR